MDSTSILPSDLGDTLNIPSDKNMNFQNHSLVGGIIIMRTHPRV